MATAHGTTHQGHSRSSQKKGSPTPVIAILKSSLIALIISIILVVVSAFLLQKQILPIESIKALNPIIKAASALIAALIGVRSFERRNFLYGGLSGLCYMAVTFIVFSLLANEFSFGMNTLIDLGMCTLAGMVGGILHGLSK